MQPDPPPPARRAAERLAVALPALAALALHAACGARYGIFRDELYFIACGERLAPGYVDQPPLIAVVARAAHAVFGAWVPGLRALPWLASAATVWLAGALALRLGATVRGAALASSAAAAAPLLLALGHYLTMNAFEPLLWTALAWVVVAAAARARRVTSNPEALRAASPSPRPRGEGWGEGKLVSAAGPLAGLAALNKYSAVLFTACVVVGLLATPARRLLATRAAALGAALGLLAVVPNVAWQARHGLPFLELVRNGQLAKNAPFSLAGFARDLFFGANPLAAPLWIGGLLWLLLARAARPVRFLGIGAALLVALLAASKGKGYYAAPVLPILFAAGGAGAERALARRGAWAAACAALGLGGLALAPIALPILAPERLVAYLAATHLKPPPLERHRESPLPQVFADQFGWEALARGVAGVYARLPESERRRAVVFGDNYGEAAAIDFYRDRLDLPPAISGHNTYWVWGVPAGRGDVVIVVSDDRETCGRGFFRRRELAARLPEDPWAMPYESGRWIWICREPRGPIAEIWPRVRQFI